ncbi:MAG: tetratricopeptide repeat protein, partial [Chloroflexota bacterium]
YYEQALTISREIGDRRGERVHLGNLGESYIALGKMEEALNYIQQSLMIAREIGHKTGIGCQFDNFGCAYEKLKNLPKALAYWRWAVVIFTEVKSPKAKESQGHLDELRAKEGEEAFDRWWAESEAEYQAIGKV